jgi:copper chaperone NosL
MGSRIWFIVVAALPMLLGGCWDEDKTEAPQPQELTREAVGHYCGMIVVDHAGPKAQLFLSGDERDPVWFTSVRDAKAFMILPDEPKNVTAIYVNDMGRAESWENPGPDTWIDARTAWFVIGSSRVGGMGAPEAVPFSEVQAANSFVEEYGGKIVRFDEIPGEYVLAPIEEPPEGGHQQ